MESVIKLKKSGISKSNYRTLKWLLCNYNALCDGSRIIVFLKASHMSNTCINSLGQNIKEEFRLQATLVMQLTLTL